MTDAPHPKKAKEKVKLELAKTCSTCKHAMFGAGDYRMGGKKQGGLCQLTTGKPPKCLAGKYEQRQYQQAKGMFEYYKKHKRLQPHHTVWDQWHRCSIDDERKKSLLELDAWWTANKANMPLVHRQTICEHWEEGPKSRESVAKKIVKEQ